MPNTKVPIELSSTPGIIDNSTVTAITIASTGAATFSSSATADWAVATVNTVTSGAGNGLYVKINDATGTPFRVDNQAGAVLTIAPSTGAATFSGNIDAGTRVSSSSAGGTRFDLTSADTECSLIANYFTTAVPLVFYTSALERMRLDTSGNLGIGMVPSAWSNAHIIDFESSDVGAQASVGDFGGQATLGQNFYFGPTGYTRKETGYASRFYQYQAAFVWQNAGTAAGGSTVTWETKMQLAGNGNLLLNTATADSAIGNGIEVTGAANKYCGIFRNTTNGFGIIFRSPTNSSVGSITWDGGTTYYSTSSDYRLKEDDVPMTGATERVKALRPINFAWKVDGSRTDGFFAHELAEVVPEAVRGTKDAMRDEEYEVTPAVEEVRDEDGNVNTEAVAAVMGTRSVPDYQGIDQSKLVPLLTATIQELIARIEALEGA